MRTGIELIAAERARQIEGEGWSATHDDGHGDGGLAVAGAAYAYAAAPPTASHGRKPVWWPWDCADWKWPNTGDPIADCVRALEKAGALIAAEIDRLQRL